MVVVGPVVIVRSVVGVRAVVVVVSVVVVVGLVVQRFLCVLAINYRQSHTCMRIRLNSDPVCSPTKFKFSSSDYVWNIK